MSCPEGFRVEFAHGGAEGLERSLSGEHVFVVLDVNLPVINGFEVLRRIRCKSDILVLMLTGFVADSDRVKGLEMGADDYLHKPFIPEELLARIRTILRRTGTAGVSPRSGFVELGDLLLDIGARRVYRDGEEIFLTASEFSLPDVLLLDAGQVIARAEMVRRVQGRSHNPYDRSIDVHISHLRKTNTCHSDGSERIKVVRGVGHFYSLPANEPVASE